MKIKQIIMGRVGRQFENNNPAKKAIAHRWVMVFAVGNLSYQVAMPATPQPTLMPKLDEVQRHIDAHPFDVQPIIAIRE